MNKYWALFITFFKIGSFTFGGGYAMIPLIEKEIVEKNNWMDHDEIIDIFAVSQSIPGAIAINTSTLVGYKIGGRIGALCATLGVILPSFCIIVIIATFFLKISESKEVEAVFLGINGAVILLIFFAARRMIISSVKSNLTIILFIMTVLIVTFTSISPIYLIILGGLIGALNYLVKKRKGAK
ncbi:MAG: chromate transporter [Vallitaleaceae bacterium]|jgi:chromate transporter|nr:chromate transporter [Vallitaleaceae bacterium]